MLSDFHVHLRGDDPSATPAKFFTTENATRYRETASERGIELLGVAEHVFRFSQSLQVWDHPFWKRWAIDDLDDYCRFVRQETDLSPGSRWTSSAAAKPSATSWSTAPSSTSGRATTPTRSGAGTSERSERRRRAASSTSSPTWTWSACGDRSALAPKATCALGSMGITEIANFERRERHLVPLG